MLQFVKFRALAAPTANTMQTHRTCFTPLDAPLALFLLSAVIAAFIGYDRSTAWVPLAVLLGAGGGYVLVSRTGRHSLRAMRIATIVSGAGALVGLYFITQYPHYPGLDKVAVISSILDLIGRITPNLAFWTPVANSIAALLEGLIFLAIGVGWAAQQRGLRWFALACAGMMALAVLFTSSRGAWLAVGLAALLWAAVFLRPARWLGYALLAGLALLAAVVLFSGDIQALGRIPLIDRTVAPLFIRPDRLDVYRGSLQLIQDLPLTGVGLGGQFAMNYSKYVLLIQVPYLEYSHNLYLEVWLQQGLLGLFAWIWLLAALIFVVVRAQRQGHNRLFEGAWVGLAAVYLHGVTDARQYSDWWSWLVFFLLMGICAAEWLREQKPLPWRQALAPLAAAALLLLAVTVSLPSLPAAWRANLGCLQQARADLSAQMSAEQRAGLRAQAMANFQRAAQLDPEERTSNLRLGLMFTEDGRYAEALPYLSAAAAADLNNRTTNKALGLGYVWNGEIDRAAQMLAPLEEMVNELNTWGWWRVSRGEDQLARYAYQTSLRIYPDQPEVIGALDALAP